MQPETQPLTQTMLSIGTIVPNYNCARYLKDRLESISGQVRPVQELIFLDDASTDGSLDLAKPLLASLRCPVGVRLNERNSGNVLQQWQLGAQLLETDLAWIAEADDSADPALTARLAACLEQDPSASFAFCDSIGIDADGTPIDTDGKAYASALGDHGLGQDGVFSGSQFLTRFLSPRNMVISASAVLWRRSALLAALAALRGEWHLWLCAGDWRTYVEACKMECQVHYLATPLNLHRRHAASVTGSASPARRFAEVVAMMALLRRRIGGTLERDTLMRGHLATLRQNWGLLNAADRE